MYPPNTILTLKEPKEPDSTGDPHPYNEVRVVGRSPVSYGIHVEEWGSAGAVSMIIEPLTTFASTIDKPLGELEKLYDVKELPPENEYVQMYGGLPLPTEVPAYLTPSPEQQFQRAEEAAKAAPLAKKAPAKKEA